jgi:stress-induced-phosphoprotein 1
MSAAEWKAKGNAALQAGNTQEAIDAYTKAIECDGTNHVFYSNRSAAYLSQGDGENALADANKCIEINGTWAKGFTRKGAALHSLKRYEDATAAYNDGLKVEPGNAGLKSGLKEVESAMAGPGAGGMGDAMASAFGPDMWGKIAADPKLAPYLADASFVETLKAIQANPNSLSEHMKDQRVLQVFASLMGLNMQMGNPGEAEPPPAPAPAPAPKKPEAAPAPASPPANETEEEKAVRLKKEEALEKKAAGTAHYKKKEFDKALECYSQAANLDPENMVFVSNRAAVHLEMKNYEECRKDCEESIEIGRAARADYSLIAKSYVRIGNSYRKEKKFTECIEAYEKANMENYTKEIERKIKEVLLLKKKADAAAYIKPELAEEHKDKGNAFFKEQKYPEAVKEYEEAIKRNPKDAAATPKYHSNLAAALMKLGSHVDAKANCEKAIDMDPTFVKAISRLGSCQFFMKEYHKALETYQKGLALEPDNAECKDGLARTQMKIHTLNSSGEVDKERVAHAMADPEIQAILRDPSVQSVLQDFQENPKNAQHHLSDVAMRAKIEKLINAGVLQMR